MTKEAIIAFASGLGITVVITLAGAAVQLGPADDLETWGRNLLFGVINAVAGYTLGWFRKEV